MGITIEDFKKGGLLRRFVTKTGLLDKLEDPKTDLNKLLQALNDSVTVSGKQEIAESDDEPVTPQEPETPVTPDTPQEPDLPEVDEEVEDEAEFDFISDEESWNESYQNGVLKAYYEWCDNGATAPYKEDLWNTAEGRAANINDAEKDGNGQLIVDENGYYNYPGRERCWNGAVNASGADYPWIAVSVPVGFNGTIKAAYATNKPVYPFTEEYKEFSKGFAIFPASKLTSSSSINKNKIKVYLVYTK